MRDAELLAVRADVHARGATEREESEAARVEAALHSRLVEEVVEEAVGESAHRRGGGDRIESERLRDLLVEESPRPVDVERGASAEEEVRTEVAEDRVDVRDRRLLATVRVADRPGYEPALRGPIRGCRYGLDRDDAATRESE